MVIFECLSTNEGSSYMPHIISAVALFVSMGSFILTWIETKKNDYFELSLVEYEGSSDCVLVTIKNVSKRRIFYVMRIENPKENKDIGGTILAPGDSERFCISANSVSTVFLEDQEGRKYTKKLWISEGKLGKDSIYNELKFSPINRDFLS